MRISNELSSTTSIITGAAGLLGVEHSIALLSLGSDVILWDLNESRLKKTREKLIELFPKSTVATRVVDITKEEDVKSAMDKHLSDGYLPKILVNNACINPSFTEFAMGSSRVENYEISSWRKELDVNITGAFICCKIVGSYFAKNKSGIVINIASDLSVISPDQRLYRVTGAEESMQPVKPISYSVSKTALIGLTRYLATYWAESGVRVNALSPGGVFDNQPPEFIQNISSRIPLGRMAERSEYRSALQFLATEDSSYMTGQNLIIDGGRSVW
jgi:NAD(P)-dependent dehydrogenase (short-subunit alcohol dehydrogenase family)